MTNFSPNAGSETHKTRWRAVPYTRGKGLDLGCGIEKLFATASVIAIDSKKDTYPSVMHGLQPIANPDITADASDLKIFAGQSLDFVYSSHLLEHFPYEQAHKILAEWMRVIRVGGHLVLYLPAQGLYPDVGAPQANPDHKWNVTYEAVVEAMEKGPYNWDLVHFERCAQDGEHSIFFAFKRLK